MTNKLLLTAATLALAIPNLSAFKTLGDSHHDYTGAFRTREAGTVLRKAKSEKGAAKKSTVYVGPETGKVNDLGELTLLVEEDFSLLKTGTEAEPDMDTFLNYTMSDVEYEYVWNNMKPEFTHGDLKWGCNCGHSAGGVLCFSFSRDFPEANLVTPMMDLTANNGTFVLEFRAKASKDAEIMMFYAEVADTRNWGPTWDNFDEPGIFETVYDDWTTYRVVFQKGGPTSICNIYAAGMSGKLYIDDVKLYSLKPHVSTPVLKRHTDFTTESFTANWEPVEGAESYLLDVWSYDNEGDILYTLENEPVTGTSRNVTEVDQTATYFYDVRAVKGDKTSLRPHPYEVFDIVAPEMLPATKGDKDGVFVSHVKPLEPARGYNFMVMAKRVADTDGPFVITDEQFTGWKHPGIEGDQPVWTIDNPYDQTSGLWYPQDINQQGWHGENFMTYKDFLCLDPYFYEMSGEQAAWISPEMDLSKDGGKISVDLKLAGKECQLWDEMGNPAGIVIADCLVGLFNWNEELADYEQVELVRCSDVTTSWKPYHVDLTKGTDRSIVAFFAVHSLDNLYIDDILIKQNYKAGDAFYDPFAYRTWLLADQIRQDGGDPEEFSYSIPPRAFNLDIYDKAQAARIHFDERNQHDGQAVSGFSDTSYVCNFYSGIKMVDDNGRGNASFVGDVIKIQNPDCENVYIYTADGKILTLGDKAEIDYRAGNGIFVVRIGNKSVKLTH